MTHDLIRLGLPEEEELAAKKAELGCLSDLVVERELQLNDLTVSIAKFQNRYFRRVGAKYAELDELRARIAEARLRQSPQDGRLREAASEARQKAERTGGEYAGIRYSPDSEEMPPVPEDVKKLYRRIASLIHPDKSTDEKSRRLRTRLMAELNDAYSKRNMRKMQEILAEWESSPDAITGEGTAAELVRVIRAISGIRRRISCIDEEIRQLKASDIHNLMLRVHEADNQGRDILAEMAELVQRQIDKAKVQLGGG